MKSSGYAIAAAPGSGGQVQAQEHVVPGGSRGAGGGSSSSSSSAARRAPSPAVDDVVAMDEEDNGGLRTSNIQRACGICAEEQGPWCTVSLPCGHGWYCADCVQRHAQARLDSGGYEVPCFECNMPLTQALLRALLSPATFDRLVHRSLEKAVGCSQDLWPCPSPNCPNRVALEEGQVPRLHCDLCGREHCLRCQATPFHEGFTCEEHAARQQNQNTRADDPQRAQADDGMEGLRTWMEQTGSRQCPRCRMAVTKHDIINQKTQRMECHKMICRNCDFKFCFKCLASLEHSTCGCTGNNHGFVDPRSGDWVAHRMRPPRPTPSGRGGGRSRGRGR